MTPLLSEESKLLLSKFLTLQTSTNTQSNRTPIRLSERQKNCMGFTPGLPQFCDKQRPHVNLIW